MLDLQIPGWTETFEPLKFPKAMRKVALKRFKMRKRQFARDVGFPLDESGVETEAGAVEARQDGGDDKVRDGVFGEGEAGVMGTRRSLDVDEGMDVVSNGGDVAMGRGDADADLVSRLGVRPEFEEELRGSGVFSDL